MFPLPDSGVELGPDPSKKDSCTGMRSMENNLDEFKGRVALIKKSMIWHAGDFSLALNSGDTIFRRDNALINSDSQGPAESGK